MLDNETRRFLSEDRFLTCTKCKNRIKVSLKSLGDIVVCPKCHNKIKLIKKVITMDVSQESLELKSAVEEYAKEN